MSWGSQTDQLRQELLAHLLSLVVVLGRRLCYNERIKLCNCDPDVSKFMQKVAYLLRALESMPPSMAHLRKDARYNSTLTLTLGMRSRI